MATKIPLRKGLFWIIGSIFCTSIFGYFFTDVMLFLWDRQKNDPKYHIVKIIQTGPEREALSTLYLTELLGLSRDKPIAKSAFSISRAETKLLSSAVIEKARVSLPSLGTIRVEYAARKPIAWLYDFTGIAVDETGTPFPLYPFYSPKILPEIYLGEWVPLIWNHRIENTKMVLALSLLEFLSSAPFELCRIDVGDAFHPSYGRRQIVLLIEEKKHMLFEGRQILLKRPRMIRLNTKEYKKEFQNYLLARETLKWPKVFFERSQDVYILPVEVFDFRIDGVGFIAGSAKAS